METRDKFYLVSGIAAFVVIAFYLWRSQTETIAVNSDASNYPVNTAPKMSASGIPLNTGSNVYNFNDGGSSIDLGTAGGYGGNCCCDGCGGSSGAGSPLVGSERDVLASIPPALLNNYIQSVPDNTVFINPVKEISKNTPMQTTNPYRYGVQWG